MDDDDDRGFELSPVPATPALARRAAPLVMAALIGGCGDPGAPMAYDAGLADAGPIVHDAGISAPPDAGPAVHDAGITADSGSSGG